MLFSLGISKRSKKLVSKELRILERLPYAISLKLAETSYAAPRRESNIDPRQNILLCLNGESSDLTKGKIRVKMTLSPIGVARTEAGDNIMATSYRHPDCHECRN